MKTKAHEGDVMKKKMLVILSVLMIGAFSVPHMAFAGGPKEKPAPVIGPGSGPSPVAHYHNNGKWVNGKASECKHCNGKLQ